MEFFTSQHSLTAFEWMLRAIVSFFFLLFVSKIMGQRSISQLRLLDFVLALMLGNIIAHPLSDEELGLKGSMITMSVLVILYFTGTFLTLKWDKWRSIMSPSPIPLIRHGKILYKNLWKARITIDYLLSELRKEKTYEVEKVALALWEPGGTISIFLESQHQPITPKDMQLQTQPFTFRKPIIKEGKVNSETLSDIGRDQAWVESMLDTQFKVKLADVLFATIDEEEKLKVFFYR